MIVLHRTGIGDPTPPPTGEKNFLRQIVTNIGKMIAPRTPDLHETIGWIILAMCGSFAMKYWRNR